MATDNKGYWCRSIRPHLLVGMIAMSWLGLGYAAEQRGPEPTWWEALFGEILRIKLGEDPPEPDVTPRPGKGDGDYYTDPSAPGWDASRYSR